MTASQGGDYYSIYYKLGGSDPPEAILRAFACACVRVRVCLCVCLGSVLQLKGWKRIRRRLKAKEFILPGYRSISFRSVLCSFTGLSARRVSM